MGLEPTLRCPCKGRYLETTFSYDAAPQGETSFDLHGSPYRRNYVACKVCGHWFGRHDLDLNGLYSHNYVDAVYGGPDGLRQKFETIMALPPEKSDNRQRVERVCAFARERGIDESKGPRLLDVGAGLGVFPAAMKPRGWHVTALEPDARTLAHLRTVAGVETLDLPLLEAATTGLAPFDIITFNKVLEHVQDPVELLMAAKALLLHDGIVYMELPDVAAACEGPGREEFFIEHHHVFSPASAGMLAVRSGFRPSLIERVKEPSGKFTIRCYLEMGEA